MRLYSLNIPIKVKGLPASAVLLTLFAIWTAVVWLGIGDAFGSVWRAQRFGEWPADFGAIQGGGSVQYSIHITFGSQTSTSLSAQPLVCGPMPGIQLKGDKVDYGDANTMSGSKFTTDHLAGNVCAISAFVQGPVDSQPNNKFQMAIYADHDGVPMGLIAATTTGILVGNSWNTLPLSTDLKADTTYWLMYNTNGFNTRSNNLTMKAGKSIDNFLRFHRLKVVDKGTHVFEVLGNFGPTTVAVVALSLLVYRGQPRKQLLSMTAYVVAMFVVLLLKQLDPRTIGDYPSGHVARMVIVGFLLTNLRPGRTVTICACLLVGVEAYSVVYNSGHDLYEVVAGLLLGAATALAVRSVGLPKDPGVARVRESVPRNT